MSNEHEDPLVVMARLEATLKGMQKQQDASERNAAQLMRLVDERVSGRFDDIGRQLDVMDAARRAARLEDQASRKEFEIRVEREIREHEKKVDALADRVSAVEKFQNKLIGMGVVLTLGTGAVTAVVIKLIGA